MLANSWPGGFKDVKLFPESPEITWLEDCPMCSANDLLLTFYRELDIDFPKADGDDD